MTKDVLDALIVLAKHLSRMDSDPEIAAALETLKAAKPDDKSED